MSLPFARNVVSLGNRTIFIPHDGVAIRPVKPVALPSFQRRFCPVAHIQAVVAASYRINVEHMRSKSRDRCVAWPRQVAMYLSRALTEKSFPDLGKYFGGRDHTTVIYSIKAVEKRIAEDPIYRADIEVLRKALV
jgi:chromosomal replication initiator protein